MKNPYMDSPPQAFWKSGVVNSSPFNISNIFTKKWDINPSQTIATAGSCFAQHIAKHLMQNGYNVLDAEPAPPQLDISRHRAFGYSMYSARYGNIYTTQQLSQLASEVVGEFSPANWIWQKGDKYYDALRPAVEPLGLDSEDEVRYHREYHLKRVHELFEEMDVLIYTLGLTETWRHKASQTIYPTAPGTIAGDFKEEEFEFVNYDYQSVLNSFYDFQSTITRLRKGKPLPKILLTVSPVPLTATASGNHILQASTYSKSVLRAVAGYLADTNEHICYFPSFEIITNQHARSAFFETNLRSVREEGVNVVMKHFFSYFAAGINVTKEASAKKYNGMTTEFSNLDAQCEEVILEAFAK
ncbi:MAG: GSCFA domain-containing protein [Alteromonadaceae bacterium]|nr:GSCFA domain-containing protein [Alteromonadaceae bacterium]